MEGGEIGVLEGARDVLSDHRPLIVLSVHPTELGLLGRVLEAASGTREYSGRIQSELVKIFSIVFFMFFLLGYSQTT